MHHGVASALSGGCPEAARKARCDCLLTFAIGFLKGKCTIDNLGPLKVVFAMVAKAQELEAFNLHQQLHLPKVAG